MDIESLAAKPSFETIARFRQKHGAESKTAVLCAGRLLPSKHYDDAIRALAISGDGLVLWIMGDGAERGRLVELAEELGVNARVHFFGWVQPDEVGVAMDACDIFLHPAVLDPFPTVVLDAMARGKPIIGNLTSGSVADRVIDGWNGYVVPFGDYSAIADRLERFHSCPDRLIEFGARAREKAAGHPVADGIRLILSDID